MILKRRTAGIIGLNLTSMIDVVFLLLVYFMVATDFQTAEKTFPMDVPIRSHEKILTLDEEPLVIFVESSGVFPSDIRLRLEGPWGSISSLYELSHFLKINQATRIRKSGFFAPAHPIRIRPTKGARWDHAIATYNVIVKEKYTNIILDEPS